MLQPYQIQLFKDSFSPSLTTFHYQKRLLSRNKVSKTKRLKYNEAVQSGIKSISPKGIIFDISRSVLRIMSWSAFL
ncbi:unnamed protein product [Gordionus sp. m RMFG-2023]